MVLLGLIEAVFELLSWLLSLLPDDTIEYPDTAGFGTTAGTFIGPFDVLFPVAELVAQAILTVTVIGPALFVYRLTLWLWGKIPIVGGGA